MRDIKFRAWDGKKFIPPCNFWMSADGHAAIANESFLEYQNWPLMQYTGLKDMNGIEIYEGDIVVQFRSQDHEVENYEVFWNKNRVGFWVRIGNVTELPLTYRQRGVEIIGNIHENPELLEKINE